MAPRKKTARRRGGKTRRSRMRGGNVAALQKIVDDAVFNPSILFPESKFVVVTYWWGAGRANANLQEPCPEVVRDDVIEGMEEELTEEFREDGDEDSLGAMFVMYDTLMKKRKAGLTPEESAKLEKVKADRQTWIKSLDNDDPKREAMAKKYAARFDVYRQKYKAYLKEKETNPAAKAPFRFRDTKTYDEMIDKWNKSLAEMKCNYLSVRYPQFEPKGMYQTAINAKPLFIKKALDVCKGRGVLYIDGDMFVRKYPKIFDMPNIDFAARSWNFDPRASRKFKEEVCFDPYIFETSGGTMFFGNTLGARKLLDDWAEASSLKVNEKKADDRILSQLYTVKKYAPKLNVLHLPIEYLWLTDNYELFDYTVGSTKVADVSECIIEHPYCLTGEERAAEMSAASNDRQPEGYDEKITEIVKCNTRGGTFYEYIFFLHNKNTVDSYGPYLKYMKNVVNSEGENVFTIVDFDDKYGKYTTTVLKNLDAAKNKPPPTLRPGENFARLPLGADIPSILAALIVGKDVMVGGHTITNEKSGIEFSGRNYGEQKDPYLAHMRLDPSCSMYIGSKNPIVIDLLAMCKTLQDINIHLTDSFVFLSRIRWCLSDAMCAVSMNPGAKKQSDKTGKPAVNLETL